MNRRKKQERTMAGQRWFERLLDWLTNGENFKWILGAFVLSTGIIVTAVFVAANLMEHTALAQRMMKIYWFLIPTAMAFLIFNIVGSILDLVGEQKLQEPITACLTRHGSSSYEELVCACMPLKLHLGIDAALERMLQLHTLVIDKEEGGAVYYHLPTQEEQEQWRKAHIWESRPAIPYWELEFIFKCFSHTDKTFRMEFCVADSDAHRMGKIPGEGASGALFWCDTGQAERHDYATFEDLTAARLFDGQSLKEVWEEVELLSINDHAAGEWLGMYLP